MVLQTRRLKTENVAEMGILRSTTLRLPANAGLQAGDEQVAYATVVGILQNLPNGSGRVRSNDR